MNNKKIKIILLSMSGIFILLFAGLFVYISQQITPEKVKRQMVTQLEKIFPGAKIEIGKVDIGIGLSISIDVTKFSIKSKKLKENDLFSVDNLRARIPLWAIFTRGGKAVIALDRPEVFYLENAATNNWSEAMGVVSTSTQAPSATSSNGTEIKNTSVNNTNIPALAYKSSLDFKLQEMSLRYQLKDNQKGQLKISKFLIKGLNLTVPTAFELDSEFKTNLDKGKQLSFQTLVIGQFNLADYLADKSINTLIMVSLSGVKANWAEYQIPDSKTEIKMKMLSTGEIQGGLKFSFNSRNNFESQFSVNKEKTLLSNIKTELFLQDLISIANMKDVEVKAGDSKFTLEGDVESLPDRILPRVKFKIAPELLVDTQDFNLKSSMDGFWKDSQFEIGALAKIFDGQIDITSRGKYLIEKRAGSKFILPALDIDVRMTDLKITKDYIQKMLYSPKVVSAMVKTQNDQSGNGAEVAKTSEIEKDKQISASSAGQSSGIDAKIQMTFNRIKIDKEDLSGKGRLIVSPSKIDLEKLDFSFTGGSGSVVESTKISSTTSSTTFNLGMNKINMKGFNAFLPPSLKSIEGIFSGTVGGSVEKKASAIKYDVNLNLDAHKGEIKGLNLTEKVQGILSSIPLLKDKIDAAKTYEVSSNFENLILKGNFKQDRYQIDKFEFIGIDKKIEMKGNGKIFPPPEKQSADLIVDFMDNTGKISALLEKNVGTKVLPMKLIGEGFSLRPDYGYTITKLAKSGFETKAKAKVQEKVMEKVQDVLGDKLKNPGVDKLFKSLFK